MERFTAATSLTVAQDVVKAFQGKSFDKGYKGAFY